MQASEPVRTINRVTDPFSAWIRAYEVAWRAAGTDALSELFTSSATYRPAPFDEPLVGLKVIARFWEDEREGPDEIFGWSSRSLPPRRARPSCALKSFTA